MLFKKYKIFFGYRYKRKISYNFKICEGCKYVNGKYVNGNWCTFGPVCKVTSTKVIDDYYYIYQPE